MGHAYNYLVYIHHRGLIVRSGTVHDKNRAKQHGDGSPDLAYTTGAKERPPTGQECEASLVRCSYPDRERSNKNAHMRVRHYVASQLLVCFDLFIIVLSPLLREIHSIWIVGSTCTFLTRTPSILSSQRVLLLPTYNRATSD